MKNLRTVAFCLSLSLYSLASSAQQKDIPLNEPDQKKPELFKQTPDKVSVDALQIASLLIMPVGEPVILDFPSFHFEGNVVSTVSKYSNSMQSVVIRSTNFVGATLTVTKVTDQTGNISYTGRIISMQHGDLYELKQSGNGLALVKNKFNNLVVE